MTSVESMKRIMTSDSSTDAVVSSAVARAFAAATGGSDDGGASDNGRNDDGADATRRSRRRRRRDRSSSDHGSEDESRDIDRSSAAARGGLAGAFARGVGRAISSADKLSDGAHHAWWVLLLQYLFAMLYFAVYQRWADRGSPQIRVAATGAVALATAAAVVYGRRYAVGR